MVRMFLTTHNVLAHSTRSQFIICCRSAQGKAADVHVSGLIAPTAPHLPMCPLAFIHSSTQIERFDRLSPATGICVDTNLGAYWRLNELSLDNYELAYSHSKWIKVGKLHASWAVVDDVIKRETGIKPVLGVQKPVSRKIRV